ACGVALQGPQDRRPARRETSREETLAQFAHSPRPLVSVDRRSPPLHSPLKSTTRHHARGAEMPMIDVTPRNEIATDARARGNVLRLAAAQALTGANGAVIYATGSIIG